MISHGLCICAIVEGFADKKLMNIQVQVDFTSGIVKLKESGDCTQAV